MMRKIGLLPGSRASASPKMTMAASSSASVISSGRMRPITSLICQSRRSRFSGAVMGGVVFMVVLHFGWSHTVGLVVQILCGIVSALFRWCPRQDSNLCVWGVLVGWLKWGFGGLTWCFGIVAKGQLWTLWDTALQSYCHVGC